MLVSASIIFTSQPAAAGGVGSSGSASGGSGGAQTTNGFGWYQYPADGSIRPRGMKAGNWDDVLATCRAGGANAVIAFAVSEVYNGGPTTSIIYNYPSTWVNIEGWLNYKGNSGNGYVRLGDAQWAFDHLGDYGVSTAGYTWHSNVAWFCWDIHNARWTVSPSTQIKKSNVSTVNSDSGWSGSNLTAKPGEYIYWKHTLTAASDKIDKNVHYEMKGRNFTNFNISNGGNSGAVANGTTFARLGKYPGANASYTVYGITQVDVGQSAICQHIEWQPYSWDNGGVGSSSERCVSVPYSYSLQPTIDDVDDGSMIESNAGNYPVTGKVQNSGDTKSHTGIQWQVTQLRYAKGTDPSATFNTTRDSASAPCAFFTGSVSCGARTTGSGTDATGFGKDEAKKFPTTGNLGDVEVGTKFCFAMSIKRASSSVTDWRHSKLYCLTVGKKPKVQVYGGDLVVGRGYNATNTKISSSIITSVINKNGTYYGSWSEYALIPSGTISGMASGSGYAGGVGSKDLCGSLSYLSFTNASGASSPICSSSSVGNYSLATSSQLAAIEARFAVSSGAPNQTGNVNIASLASGTVYPGSGSISLSSTGVLGPGKWVVINAPGADVRITSDIKYTDDSTVLTDVTQIPQLVIIAKNIVIDESVGRIDAWLLAKGAAGSADGTITTCDDDRDAAYVEPTKLTAEVCKNRLTVNGPVIANHLKMYRTAGSGTGADSGTPAEVFNLRPDAYMWASNFSGSQAKARTVYQTELPPRF